MTETDEGLLGGHGHQGSVGQVRPGLSRARLLMVMVSAEHDYGPARTRLFP